MNHNYVELQVHCGEINNDAIHLFNGLDITTPCERNKDIAHTAFYRH